MSENMKLKCSKCSKVLKVPGKYAGRIIGCPGCKQKLRVPEPVMTATLVDDEWDEPEPPPRPPKRRRATAGPKRKKETAVARGSKFSIGDWIAGILLFPIGPVLVVLFAMRKDPKWKPLLGLTMGMFVIVGGIGYAYSGDIVEYLAWEGQEDRLVNVPLSQRPGLDDGGGMTDEELDELRRQMAEATEAEREARDALMKPPSDQELSGLDEPRERAYRASVGIQTGNFGSGTGVICKIEGNKALILTNRHVIDPQFEQGALKVRLGTLPPLQIHYINDAKLVGKVIWVADDLVDLALVEAECPEDQSIRNANWATSSSPVLGDRIFTIGNPIGLGWTSTRGEVTGIRNRKMGSRTVPFVQIDANINRGNSGGGLYNAEGKLIGINTSIIDPSVAQGLCFAIRVDYLRELKPPRLTF